MNIGTPPLQDSLSGNKSIKISTPWGSFFSQLISEMNNLFTNLGHFFPGIGNDTSQRIQSDFKKSIVYNDDNERLELNNNGEFEGIQTISILTTLEIVDAVQEPGNIGRIFVNSDDNSLQFSLDGTTIRTIAST